MGYTHYWTHKRAFARDDWNQIITDLAAIVTTARAEGIEIGDLSGDKPMEGIELGKDEAGFWAGFNGVGDDAHESFMVGQKRRGWEFCKTARKPYDAAVVAALCYLESTYPAHFSAGSDGYAKDWQEGLALARRALPRLDNVLRIPAEVTFDSLFTRQHISGGGYMVGTHIDGTLCLADTEARQIVGRFTEGDGVEWITTWMQRVEAERRAKLPAKVDALTRWQNGKVRKMAGMADSFGYLQREPEPV